jgi:AAA+ superfamily predicted ATPase
MNYFEKEHQRLLNRDLPEKEMAAALERLYTDNKSFLENEDIKSYIKKTRDYQMMISKNINHLNMLLDTGNTGKPY